MVNIFSQEDIAKYAETRLFGANVAPEEVRQIELFNGTLPSQLKAMLKEKGSYKKVQQKNSREPIYFQNNTLFIPQYSGFARENRYVRMIEAYIAGKDISFNVHELENDPRMTNNAYDNFAYDFVAGLFMPSDKYNDRRVFPSKDISDITKIIIGPCKAVAKQSAPLEKGKSEYLDSQIIDVSGKKALNIGYVYADQAGIILNKMLREYHGLAKKKNDRLDIEIFMFGRVGALSDLVRQDLVFPNGIIDNIDKFVYPMHNVFAHGAAKNYIYSVTNALDETVEQLEKAREMGCGCVEMETRECVEAINTGRRRYRNSMDVSFGFVGYVSDIPLKGDTLAEELSTDKGEQDAVKVILDRIKTK